MTLRRSLGSAALASCLLLAAGCGAADPEPAVPEVTAAPATDAAPATTASPTTAADSPVPPPPEPPAPEPAPAVTQPPAGDPAPAPPAEPAAVPEPAPPRATQQDPPRGYEAPEPGPPPITTTSTTEAPPPTSTTEAPPPTTSTTGTPPPAPAPPPTEAPPPPTTSTTEAPPPTTTTEPPADVTIHITLADGRIEADRRYEVSLGDKVEVRVRSDVAEEVHLHGYDLYLQLEAGAEVVLLFEANLPGVWEAELHPSHRELFQLQVS